jgi:hypothetical protein
MSPKDDANTGIWSRLCGKNLGCGMKRLPGKPVGIGCCNGLTAMVTQHMISERDAKTTGAGWMQKNHLKPLGKPEVTFNTSFN